MASASTWERIERQKVRQRERRTRPARPGDRPDPSRPVGTDLLPQVKHIIVLMMENHSFDNYFGTLGRGRGSRAVTTACLMPRILTPRAT
jgi:phospholipase C